MHNHSEMFHVNRKYTNEAEVRDISWIMKPDDLCKRPKSEHTIPIASLSNVRETNIFVIRDLWQSVSYSMA